MSPSTEPRTLDQAKTRLTEANSRIKQLETQLAARASSQNPPKPTTSTMPQRTVKELAQALDDANGRGDQDDVRLLYEELVKVRGH
jgi:hypothetical protein